MDRRGREQRRAPEEYQIAYRHVVAPAQEEWFIAARLKFEHKPGMDEAKVRELLERRKASQPIGEWSCGSVFTNPPGDHAARLVEASGLKGYRIGDASVSQKHSNFIINHGHATAADLERLIGHVQDTVEREHGIRLKTEVRILGVPE
jgi:UDP-N-acetylmuramate dehydrogenase